MLKLLIRNLSFLFIFFIPFGCFFKEGKPIKEMRLALEKDVNTLDPRKVRYPHEITMCRFLYEGLARLSVHHNPRLTLVKDFSISMNGKLYTFELHDNYYWSNGDKITSYDFAYAWKSSLSPDFQAPLAYQLYIIKGAKQAKEGEISVDDISIYTPNPSTLIVELNEKTPHFIELLATPIFFPVHSSKKGISNNQEKGPLIGNGPFILNTWDNDQQIVLQKNAKYYDHDKVCLDKLIFLKTTSSQAMQMYESHEIDWLGYPFFPIPPLIIADFHNNEELNTTFFLSTTFLRLNTNRIASQDMRQTLYAAVDRARIVQETCSEKAIPAFTFVPSELNLNTEIPKDLAKMNLKKRFLRLIYVPHGNSYLIAQALEKIWKETLDIRLMTEPLSHDVFDQRLKDGDFDMAIGAWIADICDPINFLNVFKFKSTKLNSTFWESEEYKEMLHKSSLYDNYQKRMKYLRKAEEILLEEMPIIPLYHSMMIYLKNKRLKNEYLLPQGHFELKYAYLKDEKTNL